MASITGGSHEPQGSQLSRRTAWARLFLLIEDHAPQVLAALAGEPLTLFRAGFWSVWLEQDAARFHLDIANAPD